MATFIAELGVLKIDVATLRTFNLCLKGLTTASTKARTLRIFRSTLRALHQHYTPPQLQSMTAGQESQALRMGVPLG